jgi:hypothetical protein
MIAMTKFEMVRYLKDYADLQYLMMQHPDQQIGILFDRLMQSKGRFEDDTREYYDRMRRVYMNYNLMKKFSYSEDFLLNRDNYINDNDLDEIIPENTYSTNMGSISKKKLLQLIRNTFNHNDSEDVDRFKMSVNGRKIEIELLSGPVRIKFDTTKLWDVYNNMIKHRRNNLNISFDIPDDFDINSENLFEELDKIKFVHYYFNSALPNSTIEQFNQLNDTRGLSNEEIGQRSEMFENLSSSISAPVKFDLTVEQKKKLESYIQRYRKQNPEFLEQDINNVMFYFLIKVIPVPLLKDWILDNQILFCERFMEDVNETQNSILKNVHGILRGNNPFNPNDSFDQETFELINKRKPVDNLRFFKDLLDGEMTAGIPIITYIDSVITHCCKEETINIGGIDYSVEKIRNSFAHGRWYITIDNSIMMYDADPRNVQDYNLEFVGKIDVGAFEEWADTFVEQNKKKIDVARGSYR